MARTFRHPWPRDWFAGDATVAFDPSLVPRLGDWWFANVFAPYGISPCAFGHRLVAYLHMQDRVEFVSFDRRSGRVSVKLTGTAGDALVYLAGHTLTLAPPSRRAEIDLLAVEDGQQGGGIGVTLLSNLVDLAQALDVRKIGLKAGLDAGPYVWIRFGFFPTDQEWEKIKPPIRRKLAGLGRMVGDKARERVEAALASSSGRAIAIIAAEDEWVMSTPAFGGAPRDVSLGRALLADSRIGWYGELVFDDPEAMSIYRDCVSRNRVRRPD